MLQSVHIRYGRPLMVTVVLVALGLIALTGAPTVSASSNSFVTRSGTQLLLDRQPYRFTGLNIYHANSDGWCSYPWGSGDELDTALSEIGPGKRVFRAWFFQPLATTNGIRDWSAFDHTLAVAAAHGVRVIATLTDQWGECGASTGETSYYKTASWYTAGYTQVDAGMLASYRDWVAEVVARYKDDPTVMAWQLINEAEVKTVVGPACAPSAHEILKSWATDVSGLVKSIDANHLVSLGTIGSGQCGASGSDYKTLHDVPSIDLCEYHDYNSPTVPMPGDIYNGLQLRIDQCNALNKPIFVGEMGIIPAAVGGTLQGRANAFQAKLDAQFAADVRGILAWAWVSTDAYVIGPGDPVLDVLNYFYDFTGFFQPVDNPPTLNSAKAGSAIPVKFSLAGNQGLSVFAAGYPALGQQACETGAPVDAIEQTATAGSSGLSYDAATDTYTYVWKTSKSWAGTCRQLVVRFIDGSEYVATFKFT